jgi:hypothetical protein
MIFNIKSKGSAGALIALGIASVVLAGSVSPADAGKSGKHGKQDKHGQNQPKNPENPGPVGPKPTPPVIQGQWHAAKPQPVVRDHRAPKPTPVVRDTHGTSGSVTVGAGKPRDKTSQPANTPTQPKTPTQPSGPVVGGPSIPR